MTVAENVALPLQMFTSLAGRCDRRLVELKLSLVGLAAAGGRMPAELSGGMRKRAALARALALDPEILFFDEPSAGLDPITSERLDELILELSKGFGATVVIVSHELPSLFAICDDGVFLDAETQNSDRPWLAAGIARHVRSPDGARLHGAGTRETHIRARGSAAMNSRPAVVGGFILGALALVVAGILFFGGTRLFTTTRGSSCSSATRSRASMLAHRSRFTASALVRFRASPSTSRPTR